jgi:hypothetical protein
MTVSVQEYQNALSYLRKLQPTEISTHNYGETFGLVPIINKRIIVDTGDTSNPIKLWDYLPHSPFPKENTPIFQALSSSPRSVQDIVFNGSIRDKTYITIEEDHLIQEQKTNISLIHQGDDMIRKYSAIGFFDESTIENNPEVAMCLTYDFGDGAEYVAFDKRGHKYKFSRINQPEFDENTSLTADDIIMFKVMYDEQGFLYSRPNLEGDDDFKSLEEIEIETGWTVHKSWMQYEGYQALFEQTQNLQLVAEPDLEAVKNARWADEATEQSLDDYLEHEGLTHTSYENFPILRKNNSPRNKNMRIYNTGEKNYGLFRNRNGFLLLEAAIEAETNDNWIFEYEENYYAHNDLDQFGIVAHPFDTKFIATPQSIVKSTFGAAKNVKKWIDEKMPERSKNEIEKNSISQNLVTSVRNDPVRYVSAAFSLIPVAIGVTLAVTVNGWWSVLGFGGLGLGGYLINDIKRNPIDLDQD